MENGSEYLHSNSQLLGDEKSSWRHCVSGAIYFVGLCSRDYLCFRYLYFRALSAIGSVPWETVCVVVLLNDSKVAKQEGAGGETETKKNPARWILHFFEAANVNGRSR